MISFKQLSAVAGAFVLATAPSNPVCADEPSYRAKIPQAGPVTPPSPKYSVRAEFSNFIEVRDGTRLSTDLYFPEGAEGSFPIILVRTPYNKRGWREGGANHVHTRTLVGAGYVLAVQDVRGKFESEGRFAPHKGDDKDSYDTIDWLVAQEWSNGRVGGYGCSYLADNQVIAARERHPALRAIIPWASGSTVGNIDSRYRYFGIKNGGVNELIMSIGWFRTNGSKIYYRPPNQMGRKEFLRIADLFDPAPKVPDADTWKLAEHLPTIEIMEKAGVAPTDFEVMFSAPPADSWWDQFPYLTEGDMVDVPALFVNGWYDFGIAETLVQFNYFKENTSSEDNARNQFLVIAPVTHCSEFRMTERTIIGDLEVGDPRYDYWALFLDWFDYWLRDIDNGITDLPRVQYYVMGRKEWRSAEQFPLPQTEFVQFYLQGDHSANGLANEGQLSMLKPAREGAASTFRYDPLDPAPSRGGPLCCTGADVPPEGAFDQSDVQEREDILVFSTPPLAEGVEVTGLLRVVLYVSSDALDTDFTVRLSDVYPDGRAFNIQEGILRARYRDGFDSPKLMEVGEIYRIEVDMQATSNYFRPGHKIRLEVSSSSWPRWERNLNTGGPVEREYRPIVAHNVVHHSANHASYVLLPVISNEED